MSLKKFIVFLINFFNAFVTSIEEAKKEYQKLIASANDEKSKRINAKIAFTIVIVANIIVRILLPLGFLALLIWGLVYYFIPLLAIGLIVYGLYSHFSEKNQKEATLQQQVNQAEYRYIAEMVFNPFRELENWLPVKQPQSIYGIFSEPYWTEKNGVKIIIFSLLKKSPEKIEDEQLLYAHKMLDHLIIEKLQKIQQEDLLGFYFYNDIPCLVTHKIVDLGEKIKITILVIDNQQAYNYYNHKIANSHTTLKESTQLFDEDF